MDVLGVLVQIVTFVVQIKDAMKKAGINVEDCDTIESALDMLNDIEEKLKESDTLTKATEALGNAMSCASDIVDKCKRKNKRNYLLRLADADDISKDLDSLRKNIQLILQTVNTAAIVQILANVEKILRRLEDNRDHVHQREEVKESVPTQRRSTEHATSQIEKQSENTGCSPPTSSRSENNIQENDGPGDSKVPHAPLSDGVAESVPLKNGIGQNGSSAITNKESNSSVSKLEVNKTQPVAVSAAPFQASNSSVSKLEVNKAQPVAVSAPSFKVTISTENMTDVRSVDVHPCRKCIVTGHEGGYFSIWDYENKQIVMKLQVNEVPGEEPSFLERFARGVSQSCKEKALKHWVCSTKFIVQDKWLAVGDGHGYIYIYTYTDAELFHFKTLKTLLRSVDTLCVHPTEPYLLASSAYGNEIELWKWSSRDDWTKIQKFDVNSGYSKGVRSLKFNPSRDTKTFACVTYDGRVMVWDISSSSEPTTIQLKGEAIWDADYFFSAPSQQQLMVMCSSSASPNCEIRDFKTGKVVKTLDMDGCKIKRVAGHPRLPVLVSVSDDGAICYWDERTKRTVKMDHIRDTKPDVLAHVTDTNGLTRLVVNFKKTVVVMEFNFV